jgi:ribosomal protein L21E
MSEFKVGDRVRVRYDAQESMGVRRGDAGTVVEVWGDGEEGVDIEVDGKRGQFYDTELEHAPHQFQVGDRVKIVDAPTFFGSEQLLGFSGVIIQVNNADSGEAWPYLVKITTPDTAYSNRTYGLAGKHLLGETAGDTPVSWAPWVGRQGYLVKTENDGTVTSYPVEVKDTITKPVDPVNHPTHYARFPGVGVIEITEQLDFNRGNVVKYVARAGFKDGVDELEDLQKGLWYLNRAIEKLKRERENE